MGGRDPLINGIFTQDGQDKQVFFNAEAAESAEEE
jgi:hypothetical protein